MPITEKYKISDPKITTSEDLIHPYNVGAKPFLKWAGGKSQLLNKFQKFYSQDLKNKKIKNFYEPFLGSGAVFFDVVQKYKIENAYLYDINDELIMTYKVIQKDVSKILDYLYKIQKTYFQLNKEERQRFFYEQRTHYNNQRNNFDFQNYSEQWFWRAAQLIFLNRTCFNGLYRVNSKGEFNSPSGVYENPTICDEKNLINVHQVLQIAEIKKANYSDVLLDHKSNSFVYFDPPYRPISKTSSFKAYSNIEFADSEQKKLAELFSILDKKGAQIMLSNSDPKNYNPNDNFFDDIYKKFKITRVPARRMINSDASKRGEINEIVVTNYNIA